ncbi:MAG: HEAT repeat domain-containing protein [Cystobacter sp.]
MSGRSRIPLLALPFLILGLIAAGWFMYQPGEEDAQEPSAAASQTPAAKAAAPAPGKTPPPPATLNGTRVWTAGILYRYGLSAEQTLAFRQKQPAMAAPPGMRFSLQGEWNVGLVAVGEERIDARVNIKATSFNIAVDGEGPLAPEVQQAVGQALQVPFFVSFDKTGEVVQTHFEKGADALTRGLLRSILATSQFVVAGVLHDAWKTEEFDTTGKYQATYQRQAVHRVEKKKVSYSHLTTPMGLEPVGRKMQVTAHSTGTFELQEELWTQNLQSKERLEVDAGESMPSATYGLVLGMRLLERIQDPSLLGALAARRGFLDSAPMSSFQGVQQDPLDQYRQVLAGKDFGALLKELHELPEETNARDDARTRVLEQLRALFMLEPSEASKVPETLRTAGLDPAAASPMIGALSAASTQEAISALSQVVGDSQLSADVRTDAVAALGMAGEPNREGVDALREATRDRNPGIRDTATLGLGNAAYQMTDAKGRGSDDVVQELINAYRAATTLEQKALTLRALGNTRSPAVLDTVQQALAAPQPPLRVAALEALRNITDARVDPLLTRHLVGDPAVEVRRAALFACSFRPLVPLLPAMEQVLRLDSSANVRSDVLHLLGEQRGAVPGAMALLVWASQNESNPELRKVALDFINTPTTPVAGQATPTPP